MKRLIIALVCLCVTGQANASIISGTGTGYNVTNANWSYGFAAGAGGQFTSTADFGFGAVPLIDNYCIQYNTDIYLNSNSNFSYNNYGVINGVSVANASSIAYLLEYVAPTISGSLFDQASLEVAIWNLAPELQNGPSGGPPPTLSYGIAQSYYDLALNPHSLSLGNVAGVYWITPYNSNRVAEQGQIALIPHFTDHHYPGSPVPVVPEPSTVALLGLGGLALAAYRRCRAVA